MLCVVCIEQSSGQHERGTLQSSQTITTSVACPHRGEHRRLGEQVIAKCSQAGSSQLTSTTNHCHMESVTLLSHGQHSRQMMSSILGSADDGQHTASKLYVNCAHC